MGRQARHHSRSKVLWDAVKPEAAKEGIIKVDVSAVETRAESRAKTLVDTVKDELATKADRTHVHPMGQIAGLPAVLQQLQTRLAALEAKNL